VHAHCPNARVPLGAKGVGWGEPCGAKVQNARCSASVVQRVTITKQSRREKVAPGVPGIGPVYEPVNQRSTTGPQGHGGPIDGRVLTLPVTCITRLMSHSGSDVFFAVSRRLRSSRSQPQLSDAPLLIADGERHLFLVVDYILKRFCNVGIP
jgi:hypothetical protein